MGFLFFHNQNITTMKNGICFVLFLFALSFGSATVQAQVKVNYADQAEELYIATRNFFFNQPQKIAPHLFRHYTPESNTDVAEWIEVGAMWIEGPITRESQLTFYVEYGYFDMENNYGQFFSIKVEDGYFQFIFDNTESKKNQRKLKRKLPRVKQLLVELRKN